MMRTAYLTFNEYLRNRFGERVQKVSVDAGFTCPNRDGTKAVGGCIYCNNDSFNFSPEAPVKEQLKEGIDRARKRYGARKFMAYFQAYSNTYAETSKLYDIYSTIYDFPEIVGLAIGTRPDCVPEEVLRTIIPFTKTHEVWMEYGLESSNDDSLRRMNRAHTFADFKDAVLRTAGRGMKIGTHVIAGFPWETETVMLQTARDIAELPVDGIKIHNLHVVKGTALEKMFERNPFPLLSLQEYASIAARMLGILPPQMVIMRLTAECPPDLLVAPDWCNQKSGILQAISEQLHRNDSFASISRDSKV
jgi:radical SAM protein (TIGR01212 family)